MTKEWYKSHGYNISINIDQAAIDRAEDDVMRFYINPILPEASTEDDEEVAHVVAALSYTLLMQRSIHLTRSGAKDKTSSNSMNADAWSILAETAHVAAHGIEALRLREDAVAGAKVADIAKIYFTTNFIHS